MRGMPRVDVTAVFDTSVEHVQVEAGAGAVLRTIVCDQLEVRTCVGGVDPAGTAELEHSTWRISSGDAGFNRDWY